MTDAVETATEELQLPQIIPADHRDLAATAQLLHDFNLARIELESPRLGLEPRATCQCLNAACAAVWIASKSGEVMRIGLAAASGRPEQRWFPGDRGARAIYHQHNGTALGDGAVLLVGRDDGTLEIIPDRHPDWTDDPSGRRRPSSVASFHVDSWWASRDEVAELAVGRGFPRQGSERAFASGITAIAVLERRELPGMLHLLVATRFPWLYLIEVDRGRMRLRRRLPMPGWIEWIFVGAPGDDLVACISRGGDIIRLSYAELVRAIDGDPITLDLRSTALLPTAAMSLGESGVLLGTTTGLFLVSDDHPDGIEVPATGSPVLCLDRLVVREHDELRDYLAMGLEDGRLRLVETDRILALASGVPRPRRRGDDFAVDLGGAVLAVEALRLDTGSRDAAYLLAVLRDHSIRLFHLNNEQVLRVRAGELWNEHISRVARASGTDHATTPLATALLAARAVPDDCERNAWNYMLIDVVLPRLYQMALGDGRARQAIVDLACEMASGSDRFVLHRLSAAVDELTAGNVDLVLQLSRSILRAVPHRDDRHWSALIEHHLRELNAIARLAEGGDRARLVGWMRFVRKYVLLGHTFAAKRFGLLEDVERNHEARKYLDALIYQARISQRGYDLRWESQLGADVGELHVVDCGARRTIVVAATLDGKLVFLDGASGRRLAIRDGGRQVDTLAPFGPNGPVRTLACAVAVVHPDRGCRVALSCTGVDLPSPGLAVCDVAWSDRDITAAELTVRISAVACADPAARVYALRPLPGRPDAFVAGLETRAAPIGLVGRLGDGRWTLELANDESSPEQFERDGSRGPIEQPRRVPPKLPTRALAVAAVDDLASRYLVVAGADDGAVCATSFAWTNAATTWRIGRWDRVPDAITSVVLARHRRRPPLDPDDSQFSCYLGTSAGDTFAWSIAAADAPGVHASGDNDPRPLWRDTHDGPVLAMQLWRTPLFGSDELLSDEVLVVATEQGRLTIYSHSADGRRVSTSGNYYFQGMRLERVVMPERLRALSVMQDGRDFVAGGPGGRIYTGKLVYLRDSVDQHDPEDRASRSGHDLPDERWARMRHLLAASRIDALTDVEPARRDDLKLELCELVRIEGGALLQYILRERLLFHEPWHQLRPDELTRKARRLLSSLDPENPDDAQQVTVIIRTLCSAFLLRDPRELRAEILAGSALARHAETAAACAVAADYLTRDLAYYTPAAARLRSVVIRELLRAPIFHHIACGDDHGARIRASVEAALESCLRDDAPLVRTEGLRATSIALRNIAVMVDGSADGRSRLLERLFPDGAGSVTWLLQLIVSDLSRFPGLGRGMALTSGAWYAISALLPLFQIFSDRTLTLCDYLVRGGVSVDVLAACCRSLRGTQAAPIRKRIEHFYVLSTVDRDRYIEQYDETRPIHQLILSEVGLTPRMAPAIATAWHQIDDATMAGRLSILLDLLARMWNARTREQLRAVALAFRPAAGAHDASLWWLEDVVGKLVSIAADLAAEPEVTAPDPVEVRAMERLAELGAQHGPGAVRGSCLTAPVRTIVSGIAASWRELYAPTAERGMRIGRYVLGTAIAETPLGTVFDLDGPPELAHTHVIKVLRRLDAPGAARRFLAGARLNQQSGEPSGERSYIIPAIDVLDRPPYLAYVMPRYDHSLEDHLRDGGYHRALIAPWAAAVAEHIGRALLAIHRTGRCHRNVTPRNILVSPVDGEPVFHLGDFDLAYAAGDPIEDPVERVALVPERLSRKYVGDALGRLQWEDIAALAVILYRMLTGAAIDPSLPEDLDRYVANLRDASKRLSAHPRVSRLVEALKCIFGPSYPALDIHEFVSWISSPLPSFGANDGP
jgi:hypothetical protein